MRKRSVEYYQIASMKKRRTHQPEFKARVALEAVTGLKTTSELAKAHTLHPVQISEWKRCLQDRAAELFGRQSSENTECLKTELERAQSKIGQLTLDLDYLKKSPRVWA
jgi:transposase-like protein